LFRVQPQSYFPLIFLLVSCSCVLIFDSLFYCAPADLIRADSFGLAQSLDFF
jgi:hypothetical protein